MVHGTREPALDADVAEDVAAGYEGGLLDLSFDVGAVVGFEADGAVDVGIGALIVSGYCGGHCLDYVRSEFEFKVIVGTYVFGRYSAVLED